MGILNSIRSTAFAQRGGVPRSIQLMASAAMALPLSLGAHAALAQDAAAPSEAQDVQEVVVTGSRVARSGFTTPTPTTVVSQELINSSAASGIANVLQSLP